MPNLYRMLENEHRHIAGLLDELLAAPAIDHDGRRLLFDRLVVAESRHEAAEEMSLWPAVRRRAEGGRELHEEGLRQEGDARYVLDALRFETDDQSFRRGLEGAAALLRAHIEFEEQRVWPALKHATGPIGAQLTGARYSVAARMTPTRPHPGGPQKPVGLATMGVAAAATDRIRDVMSGRRGRAVVPARRAATGESPAGESPAGGSSGHGASDGDVDGLDFLVAEHARIDGLFREMERHGPGDEGLVDRIVRELAIHDSIERQYLYPLARRRLQDGNDIYDHSLAEHGRVASVLGAIDRRPAGDAHRAELLAELPVLVRTHVAEEETGILPALRAHLAPEEVQELGRQLSDAHRHAPTRPHAHTAGAGLGARMSRLVAGPLDRTRDAISGRR